MASFDVIEGVEAFPVVAREGGGREANHSLIEVLTRAHEIERLAPELPTMIPAMMRHVFLPIVLDALGFPENDEDWGDRWRRGRFDADAIAEYLEENRDRFDLFHPEAPFAQAAGLRASNDQLSSVKLLMPSGANIPLFSVGTDADVLSMTPAEAFRWLLHLLCWDTAGIKTGAVGDPSASNGKAYGNPVGPLGQLGVVMPTGRNLFETLMLNSPIQRGHDRDDLPSWKRPPLDAEWRSDDPKGPLELFTWMPRRVRLVPDTDDQGRAVVRHVVVAAGDRLRSVPGFEPHTTWTVVDKPKGDDPPFRPRRHRLGQEMWQGLPALLAVPAAVNETGNGAEVRSSGALGQVASLQVNDELDRNYPLGVTAVGVAYGSNAAIFDYIISDTIPLPLASLSAGSPVRDLVERLAANTEELVKAVNLLDADLRRAAGGEPTPWDKGQRPGTRVIHQLDAVIRRLLAGLQHEPEKVDEAEDAWRVAAYRTVRQLGDELLAAVSPGAFVGRKEGGDGKRKMEWRVATAERAFRSRVWKTLGDLYVDDQGERPENDGEVMA